MKSRPVYPTLALLALLASATAADAVPYNTNLIANPGAEAGSGSPTGNQVPVPGWTTTGAFTVIPWNAPGGYPSSSSPGPSDRAANFFAGGNAQISTATQEIDVTANAADINQGTIIYDLSGWFGGYQSDRDAARLTVAFYNGLERLADGSVGSVTPTERNNVTGLLFRLGGGAVPPNTTRIVLTQIMTRTNGNSNDGYADSLSFILRPRTTPAAIVNSVFAGNGKRADATGPWSAPTRWSPPEVPNNTADKFYNVSITGTTLSAKLSDEDRLITYRFGSVYLDVDATINNLTLESAGFRTAPGVVSGQGLERNLSVLGTTRDLTKQLPPGVEPYPFDEGNIGFTVQAFDGDSILSLGTFLNFSGNTLTSTSLRLTGSNVGAIIRFRDADIVKLENTGISLDGSGTQIQDQHGNDALRHLSQIDADSGLGVADHLRAWQGSMTVDGSISATTVSANAGLTVGGVLTNFDPVTRTLHGSRLGVANTSNTAGLDCFLRFQGLDIVNNAGRISLRGPNTRIIDENGSDALRNFANNQVGAELRILDRDFTTGGAFTNAGSLSVTTLTRNATVTISSALTNFDAATRTLSGGSFEVFGNTTGTPHDARLVFPGADIVHNNAELRLGTRGAIVNEAQQDALRNLVDNQASGRLELIGVPFAAPSDFSNSGSVALGNSSGEVFSVPPGHSYIQTGGETSLFGSILTAATVSIRGGQLHRGGIINGNVFVEQGTIAPTSSGGGGIANMDGLIILVPSSTRTPGPSKMTINGNLELRQNARYSMVIRGTPESEFDKMAVSGNATFGGTFEVELINNFVPAPGDSFTVLTAGAPILGAFSNIPSGTRFPTKDGRGSFIATYNGNNLVLSNFETGTPAQLLNISTRMRVLNGENVLIGGFIITGSAPKKVIIRGIGPSLAQFFNGALGDPHLELFQGSTSLVANDNWKENEAEIAATGIPPSHDLESAIVRTLAPGAYTAVLRGSGGATGIGLVEAYDLDQSANSKLANIATRGFVDTGDNVMIGGFIIGGGTGARVVIRAIGPSLTAFGIGGALDDPTLELKDANGTTRSSNDDWKTSQTEIEVTGLAPSVDRESALVTTLSNGNYTAIVRGKNSTTGVALVEVYHLQ